MDKIILTGIQVHAYGGVSAAEKEIGQRYLVQLEMCADLTAAARSDSVLDAIDYGQVYGAVVEIIRERPFTLLESVTARIAERVLERFPVRRVTVRLEKLLPPVDGIVAAAAVEIARQRS